jgi:hypothetical protein
VLPCFNCKGVLEVVTGFRVVPCFACVGAAGDAAVDLMFALGFRVGHADLFLDGAESGFGVLVSVGVVRIYRLYGKMQPVL